MAIPYDFFDKDSGVDEFPPPSITEPSDLILVLFRDGTHFWSANLEEVVESFGADNGQYITIKGKWTPDTTGAN